jgi:hypothetical protein
MALHENKATAIPLDPSPSDLGEMERRVPHERAIAKHPKVSGWGRGEHITTKRFTHFVTPRDISAFAFLSWRTSFRWLSLLLVAGNAVPVAAQLSYSEIVLQDGPFAYWRLDETDTSAVECQR